MDDGHPALVAVVWDRDDVQWDRDDVQLDASVVEAEEVQLRPVLGLDQRGRRRVGHRDQNVRVPDPVAPS